MSGACALSLFDDYRITDYKSPIEYLDYLFHDVRAEGGYVYRAQKVGADKRFVQMAYKVEDIWKQPFLGIEDGYVSMNTFWRERSMTDWTIGRDVEHLKRLNACYVDLDYYKDGLTQKEVLAKVHLMIKAGIIPKPSIIMNSGQGIYLIWKLRNEDCKALSRWQRIQHYFINLMKDLGADANCADAARVLRVPGTINSKNDSDVGILEFTDVSYSIHEIIKDYNVPYQKEEKVRKQGRIYPFGHATEAQRRYVRDLARKQGLTEAHYPNFESFQETDTWIKSHTSKIIPFSKRPRQRGWLGGVCADIRKLFTELRKGKNCYRETGAFLYRFHLREMGLSAEEALAKTLELNAAMDCPLPEREARDATASADRFRYRFKRSKIIEMLDITQEELEQLPCLGSNPVNRKERKKEANRKAYQSRLAAEGKVAKKDAIRERRIAICNLKEQGLTAAEIQAELKISKATYNRDLAAIRSGDVMEAVQLCMDEMVDQVATAAEQAVETVSSVAQSVKNFVAGVTIWPAQNTRKQRNFGCLKNSASHLRESEAPQGLSKIAGYTGLRIYRTGDRASGDEPDSASG